MLETNELLFRGEFRLKIPFAEVTRLNAEDGCLTLAWPGGEATFVLDGYAEKWAQKIRNPRGLLDKLGVKPGSRVCILGMSDEGFLARLRDRTDDVTVGMLAPDCDLVFYEADTVAALDGLSELRRQIKSNGAIWVVSPKGKGALVRDVDVINAAKAAGLVDTKVVSFSETHTALKLVIPVAIRQSRGQEPSR